MKMDILTYSIEKNFLNTEKMITAYLKSTGTLVQIEVIRKGGPDGQAR